MKKLDDLRRLVVKIVADYVDRGVAVTETFITAEAISHFPGITGSDADFYQVCARAVIYKFAKECIGKYGNPVNGPQAILDGFEHLQKAYPVKRGNTKTLMPIRQMTLQEIMDRADLFDKQGNALKDHARELRDFAGQALKVGHALKVG